MNSSDNQEHQSESPECDSYEPPRIETVLTADELAREVLYAGVQISNLPPPPPPQT